MTVVVMRLHSVGLSLHFVCPIFCFSSSRFVFVCLVFVCVIETFVIIYIYAWFLSMAGGVLATGSRGKRCVESVHLRSTTA